MKEIEIQQNLIKKLIESGYPESSIRQELAVTMGENKRGRIDIAIIDSLSSDVIAIFEVKARISDKYIDMASQQVINYSKFLPSAPLAYIYLQENGITKILQVDESTLESTEIQKLPSFETLIIGDKAQSKIEAKQKSKKTIDGFKLACYTLAVVVFLILFLDVFSIYKFTTQQLSLLGIFIGLLIMPYAAKFKLLGMEFERYKQ